MKKCLQCNKEIPESNRGRKYCSPLCGSRYRRAEKRRNTERECAHCGTGFVVTKTTRMQKFCTSKCCAQYQEAHRKQPDNTCDFCGASFKGRFRTCSPECALALSNQNRFFERDVVCVECGKVFTARHGRSKLCSNACSKRRSERRWRAKQPERECEWCGEMYFPRNPRDKSCSKACAYAIRMRTGRKKYKCEVCGKLFDSNWHGGLTHKHVCSDKSCQDTAYKGTAAHYKHGYRQACYDIWGAKKCLLCSSKTKVQAHHVSGNPSDNSDVVWLCKKHHNAVHHKFITKNPKTPQDYQDGLSAMWYSLFKGELD